MTRSWGAERDVAIVACAVSAGIHAALVPEHVRERTAAGMGFLVSAVLLAGLAFALSRSARPPVLALTVATMAGLIAAYALAVTKGVPVLHPEVEPVEGLALATKAIEAAGLVAATRLLAQGRRTSPLIRLERTLT